MKNTRSADVEFDKEKMFNKFCKGCVLVKSTKLPHKSVEKIDNENSHIVIHSYLVKTMKTESLGFKFKYIPTFLCNQTVFFFVYFLREKSEQFEKFKEFLKFYEILKNQKFKELRTDNGREYLSYLIQSKFKEYGKKHNTSVSYCPESNGKAEWLNMTLLEKARCMLISAY